MNEQSDSQELPKQNFCLSKTGMQMFIEALVIIVQTGNNPNVPN